MLSRSDSRSISAAVAAPIAVASRARVPSRSIFLPAVERRHSVTPAPSTLRDRQIGRGGARCRNCRCPRRPRSRARTWLVLAAMRFSRRPWPTMIAQVHTEAASRPTITTRTTISACRNSASGDMVAALVIQCWRHVAPGSPCNRRKVSIHAAGCRFGRPSMPTNTTVTSASDTSSSPRMTLC